MTAIWQDRYDRLQIDLDGHIATIVLANPAKKNALTWAMHRELERVWSDIDDDDRIRVVVLVGEGDAFCAGVDFSTDDLAAHVRPPTRGARRLFWNMLDCEKPIIAKVRGPAFGLGASIALLADVVIASDKARFCDSHVRVGIAPGDGGAALWPLLIGFNRAKEFLMLGEPLTAARAAELGLVNHCVADDQLDGFVASMAARLAEGAPLAVSYAKMGVNLMLKQVVAGAFEQSLAYDMLTLKTADHAEGVSAFTQRRPPRFTGQ